jgi:putative transposase
MGKWVRLALQIFRPDPFSLSPLYPLIGKGSLRRAVHHFCEHYRLERNHQGLGNKIIEADFEADGGGVVKCRERLGGLLRYYHRDAA